MSQEVYGEILKSVRDAHAAITEAETGNKKALVELRTSVDELYRRTGRPGGEGGGGYATDEHKDAARFCELRRDVKSDGKATGDYVPSYSDIEDAKLATKALHGVFRGSLETLPVEYRKSLSSFAFGSNSFMLAPTMSDRVLSCLTDPTDVAGLMGQATTSTGSLKFFIDHQRMQIAGWACEATCFANNPLPDLQEGLGELEIKVEELRFVVCANNNLLADASFNVEQWILQKASQGFRDAINNAIMAGDGLGRPLGILHPTAGIPICETSPATPTGQFTWQDLVMLKYEIPTQWHSGASYLMNQRTFALLMTMSDTTSRPLWGQLPGGAPGYMLAGSPINIVSQMPDVGLGSTPIAFGNWREAYIVVIRSGTTMQTDPYSAGWCTLFKFTARVGGSVGCPNAARLLRIR